MERTIGPFTELVLSDLEEVKALMLETSTRIDPNLKSALNHVLISGGKRLRPTLTLLTGAMLGASQQKTIILAAAIEMLHNATLVHDDLIDGALLRRGIPTLNAQWSAGATVLTGDYVFARAAQLASETGSLYLMNLFAEKLMIMVNGEIMQLFGTSNGDIRKDYYDRIYAKTASLFEISTHGAALLSEYDENYQQEMKAFGYEIGIAFQIVDDILDFTGDPKKVGKPIANDLQNGVITLPTIHFFEAHPEDPLCEFILKKEPLSKDYLLRLVDRIKSSGAIDQTLEEAKHYIVSARERLSHMPAGENRDALYDLANYIVQRPF